MRILLDSNAYSLLIGGHSQVADLVRGLKRSYSPRLRLVN